MSPPTVVGSQKLAELAELMARAGIEEADLEEHFIRSSGPGGQKVNKTASAVYLRHPPSGEDIKVQISRSQALNRYYARKLLAERLEAARLGKASKEQARIEKVRRQKRRRSRRAKAKTVADKRLLGAKKRTRGRPPTGE
jgi:protein subunit release factor B